MEIDKIINVKCIDSTLQINLSYLMCFPKFFNMINNNTIKLRYLSNDISQLLDYMRGYKVNLTNNHNIINLLIEIDLVSLDDNNVLINVGGTNLLVNKEFLTLNLKYFEAFFKNYKHLHPNYSSVLIDRSPNIIKEIINFMQNDKITTLGKNHITDLNYYCYTPTKKTELYKCYIKQSYNLYVHENNKNKFVNHDLLRYKSDNTVIFLITRRKVINVKDCIENNKFSVTLYSVSKNILLEFDENIKVDTDINIHDILQIYQISQYNVGTFPTKLHKYVELKGKNNLPYDCNMFDGNQIARGVKIEPVDFFVNNNYANNTININLNSTDDYIHAVMLVNTDYIKNIIVNKKHNFCRGLNLIKSYMFQLKPSEITNKEFLLKIPKQAVGMIKNIIIECDSPLNIRKYAIIKDNTKLPDKTSTKITEVLTPEFSNIIDIKLSIDNKNYFFKSYSHQFYLYFNDVPRENMNIVIHYINQ